MTDRYERLVVCCNGAPAPSRGKDVQRLDYRPASSARNVTVGLPAFVQDVYHIPSRILDLLEIAAYVFSADRLAIRGRRDDVEYQRWSRRFQFRIRVRDPEFWGTPQASRSLSEALAFISGDADYEFEFLPGHSTPPTSLFDQEGFSAGDASRDPSIVLFSGGLDSLAGVLEALHGSQRRVILVSHQSQSGTTRTQRQLVHSLHSQFGADRLPYYKFRCHLKGHRAAEETQRTRAFLFSSIGFAMAMAYGQRSFSVCENGVTSMNLSRRQDLFNARASRTTHPQTIARLSRLFSLIAGEPFAVRVPFLWCTKSEVVDKIAQAGSSALIASTVSCSRTFQRAGEATHCGKCFQCFDRRIAMHALAAEAFDDAGLYASDVISTDITDPEARTTIVDYVRQAQGFSTENLGYFEMEHLAELAQIVEYLPEGGDEFERTEKVFDLMQRHGMAVAAALRRMRELHDDPFRELPRRSLLGLLADREHLKPEVARAVESIVKIVEQSLGQMFRRNRPKNEPDLNEKLGALIKSHEPKLRSEYPSVRFASSGVIPDHDLEGHDLVIETKYIRKGTPPSKATDGMAADLTKYPANVHILFLVYDPDHATVGDEFRRDFEAKGRCTVRVLR